jgi:enolase
MLIKEISAKRIFDSRNKPTIEVSVNNCKSSSPSGKSTGKTEALPFKNSVEWNINAINSLSIPFEISSFNDLNKLEKFIKEKFKLKKSTDFGANALFALESAILKALAKSEKKELWQIINPNARKFPVPLGNSIGGGVHSEEFSSHPTFQEFLLVPIFNSIKKNVEIMNKVYNNLKKQLNAKTKNDEGAWQTSLNEEQILEILSRQKQIRIGIDIAADSFYKNKEYVYNNKNLDRTSQIHYINSIIKKYNLLYLEDPLEESDFKGFAKILNKSKKYLICGDDLTTTHLSLLKKAIKNKSINCMIVKPNQTGSLIEVRDVIALCKKNNIKTVISHRSGETMDTTIADLAFAFQTDFIKTGISTKYRECKLNRLIEIENSLK